VRACTVIDIYENVSANKFCLKPGAELSLISKTNKSRKPTRTNFQNFYSNRLLFTKTDNSERFETANMQIFSLEN
jgi:hypothetical protein